MMAAALVRSLDGLVLPSVLHHGRGGATLEPSNAWFFAPAIQRGAIGPAPPCARRVYL